MIHPKNTIRRLGLLAVAVGLPMACVNGQTTAQKNASSKATTEDDSIELTPFVVSAASDKSYGALNSNSITSFNTELEKLPISADIFTGAFMEDTNSSTLEEMLRTYSAGSGTGSAGGDVSGIPVNQPMDRGGGDSVSAGVQLRGLGAAVVKQDSFMLPSPAGTGMNSTFGVERVEVINGPQALLYGNGGGGGVINVISKQARFSRSPSGMIKGQIDQYGHSMGELDYSMGSSKIGLTLSALRQELGDNRDFLGGPLNGLYGQIAVRPWRNTVIRLTGKYTHFERFVQQALTLNAGSTTADARHNQKIRYLLATDQINASLTGASGAGVIGNGNFTWDNVDSWAGNLREEVTTARLGQLVVENNWRPWLSTQLSLGYQNKDSMMSYGSGATLYAPNASSNPIPGQWVMAAGGSTNSAYSNQPSSSKSIRFSTLLTNNFLGGTARSQTIFGAEHTRGDYANENFAYYEADSDYNIVYTSGSRTRLSVPNPYWSVSDGPVKYPVWHVGTPKITYNGKNYVIQQMALTDPSLVTAQNPQGVTSSDIYIHSRAISKGAFAVNNTQWMDGKLATLAGVRWVSANNRQYPSGTSPAVIAKDDNLSFSAGANFGLAPSIRPYLTVSDTYNLPGILLTVPADPYGNALPISHSIGEEVGIKLGRESARVSGSIAVFALQSKNEAYSVPTNLRDSINPSGLNGRYSSAAGTVVPVERKSEGLQVALTANPTSNWRMRLSAAVVHGTIGNTTTYAPLYNDQFYTNSAGQVTYSNGTVVYVKPTASTTPGTAANAGYVPLTIAKLSDPTDPYYANPDAITGALGSSTGKSVLNTTTNVNGPIKTGVTGLPISALQITGVNPISNVVVTRAGDKTTGYPEMSFSFTNMYTFSTGILRGLKLGGTINCAWRRGDFYYYPNGYTAAAARELYYRPTSALFNGIFGYERKFRRVTWSMQVNINNMFNHYLTLIRPNNISGYSGVCDALSSNQPREYTWSSSIKF